MPEPAPPTTRVLFLYLEATGAGHRRAAEAVATALRGRAESELINVADYMNEALFDAYHKVRSTVLRDAPHVIGQLYRWYDRTPEERSLVDEVILAIEKASLRALIDDVLSRPWDVVVHTHFFPAELVAHLRRKEQVSFPHATVTTDFVTHGMWLHQPCELFFVADEEAGRYLEYLGAAPQQVKVTGIPVDPQFGQRRLDPAALEAELTAGVRALGSKARRPRVALMTGGYTAEVARDVLMHLLSCRVPLEITAVAGSSSERFEAMTDLQPHAVHKLTVIGATSEVPALFARTDVVAGKAGGLTSSEALAIGCPLLIVNPTPDQELQNNDYLLEHGAAVRAHTPPLVPFKLEEMFSAPERWARLRRGAYELGRPRAANDVAEHVLSLCTGSVQRS